MRTIISALLLVLIMAGTSFAAATAATLDGANPKGFVPSHNVNNVYQSAQDPSTQINDRYTVATKHINGDKIFGSVSGSGTIYFAAAPTGTILAVGNQPTIGGSSTDSTVTGGIGGWSAM
jgi:hypothetical protein